MLYQPQNFDYLLGLVGFSDQLLKNHFALYQGYVKNVNLLSEELHSLLQAGKTGTPGYAELKRRFGWEFNGMRLHEYYFENMGHAKSAPPPGGSGPDQRSRILDFSRDNANAPMRIGPALYKKILEGFGSYDAWEKDFRAVGAMRGIGWAVFYADPAGGNLFNVWVNEHDMGHLAGAKPLLVLDVFEHAYMLDYGLKKADYIEAFFKAIDWAKVSSRFP